MKYERILMETGSGYRRIGQGESENVIIEKRDLVSVINTTGRGIIKIADTL